MLFHHQTIRKQCKPMQNVRLPLDLQTCTTKSPTQRNTATKNCLGIQNEAKLRDPEWSEHPQHQTTPKQHQETHLKKPTLSSKESRWQACLQRWIACSVCWNRVSSQCTARWIRGLSLSFPKSTSTCQSDQNASICNRTLVWASQKGLECCLISCTPLQHINIFIKFLSFPKTSSIAPPQGVPFLQHVHWTQKNVSMFCFFGTANL